MSSQATPAFGPVPATVAYPKLQQAPQGARYCEEVDAYVPADLPYRIRGIATTAPRAKKTLVQRILRKPAAADSMVMAMGLTHGVMHLVPLDVAQQTNAIRYRGLDSDDTNANDEAAAVEKRFGGALLPLWEAQARAEIRYRGKNPLRGEQLTPAAAREPVQMRPPMTRLPIIPLVDGKVAPAA